MESQYDYKIGTEMTYGGRDILINMGKAKDNFDKDRIPKCFNCKIYGHIVKKCQKPKREREMRKYFKCDKTGHLEKDCRIRQKIKNRSIQEDLNEEGKNKQESFVGGSE